MTTPADFVGEPVYGFHIPRWYTGLQPVGRGAFGLVCKANVVPGVSPAGTNAYFGRLENPVVAIKKLGADTAFQDAYHAKQVYREISLLKQLTHPNLIKLVDLFISPVGDLYIVTEAMECDLAAILRADSFELTEQHVQFISYQILCGLKYLHSGGVLHRDLKPQNILINHTLEACICDLGLARVSSQDGLATGYVTTRWYRAPEVMFTWQSYTSALDAWSAGCIIAEMLNRLVRRVTYVDPKKDERYYALFPADSHVDHLKLILSVLGEPPPAVIAGITEDTIRQFVLGKVEEVRDKMTSLSANMEGTSPSAIGLLLGLLDYNPDLRLSAANALAHPYLETFRDPEDEFVRPPISSAAEGGERDLDEWRALIQQEVCQLAVIDPALQAAHAAAFPNGAAVGDGGDLGLNLDMDLGAIGVVGGTGGTDLDLGLAAATALAPMPPVTDVAVVGAASGLNPLTGLDQMVAGAEGQPQIDFDHCIASMEALEQENQQLHELLKLHAPGSQQHLQLLASMDELTHRHKLYQQTASNIMAAQQQSL